VFRTPVISDIRLAAQSLREGRLVAFPTETVYGLGAYAENEFAVARVFEAKERPHFDPLIVHIPSLGYLDYLVTEVSPVALRLAEAFWPGPLTILFPKREAVPDLVTSGLPSVGIRIPDHPVALALLNEAGVAIAAPSANRFGCLSPTTAEHVAEQLDGRIDWILDGGPCRVGVESTVVRPLGDTVELLRPGGVSVEQLEAVLGQRVVIAERVTPPNQPGLSPGTLDSHYAPKAQLLLDAMRLPPRNAEQGVGWLALRDRPAAAQPGDPVELLSATGQLTEAAAGFFAALRRLDAAGVRWIVAELFPEEGLGRALNDRLLRGSAPRHL